MTTFADGAPPSVTPEPDDGSGPRDASSESPSSGRAGRQDADEVSDTGSSWLRDEIQRRISEGRTSGSTGRHARHGTPGPDGAAAGYVPRHSVATPGPGAPRPGPVGGQMSSQAGELLRRERTASAPAWLRPGDGPGGAGRAGPDQPREPGPPAASPLPAGDPATPGARPPDPPPVADDPTAAPTAALTAPLTAAPTGAPDAPPASGPPPRDAAPARPAPARPAPSASPSNTPATPGRPRSDQTPSTASPAPTPTAQAADGEADSAPARAATTAPASPGATVDGPAAQAPASSGPASSGPASSGPVSSDPTTGGSVTGSVATGDPAAGDPAAGGSAAGGVRSSAAGPLRPAPSAPAPADPAPGSAQSNATAPVRSTASAAEQAPGGPAAGTAPSAPDVADPAPAPSATESQPVRSVRPGVAAAAAVRGAARGRARTAGPPAPSASPAAPAEWSAAPTEQAPGQRTPAADPRTATRPPTASSRAGRAAGPNQRTSLSQVTTPVPVGAPGSRPVRPGPGTPDPGAAPDEASQGDTAADDAELTARTPAGAQRTGAVRLPEQRGGDQPRGAVSVRPDSVDGGTEDDDEQASRRVRVVLAERKGVARPVRTVVDIQEGTGVGELLRTNLIGSQLAVALRFAVGAGLALGLLPLLFAMVPEIGRIEVLGLRLPWLLLGVLVYPFLFLLGWWHTRTAERVEQNFADHVQD